LLLLLAGCGGEKAGQDSQQAGAPGLATAAVPSVRAITLAGLQQMIRNRDGKRLVLNMWATWCVPCREEFPDLAQLAKKTGATTEVVGISLDYPEEMEAQVIPFLRQNPVNFSIYVAEVASQDDFINFFNPDWSGALPTTFIYDADGRQTEMMTGKHTLADFENALSRTSLAPHSE